MLAKRWITSAPRNIALLFLVAAATLMYGCRDRQKILPPAGQPLAPSPAALGLTGTPSPQVLPTGTGETVATSAAPPEEITHTIPSPVGDFALFLLDWEVSPADSRDLTLPEEPLISLADIASYDSDSHLIRLAPGVRDRLDRTQLAGKTFVVAMAGEPRYTGLFMAPYMSRSFNGVVILWPPMTGDANTLAIQLGYPGPQFFVGTDPRSDEGLMEALRLAGKLGEP